MKWFGLEQGYHSCWCWRRTGVVDPVLSINCLALMRRRLSLFGLRILHCLKTDRCSRQHSVLRRLEYVISEDVTARGDHLCGDSWAADKSKILDVRIAYDPDLNHLLRPLDEHRYRITALSSEVLRKIDLSHQSSNSSGDWKWRLSFCGKDHTHTRGLSRWFGNFPILAFGGHNIPHLFPA